MKKIYSLLFIAISSITFAQTTFTQWNFDDASPATAMLPTTGAGTFSLIGGVVDNLTAGLMPAGNPSSGKAYSVKTFPASTTASGTAGFEFKVNTNGITDQINVSFDPRGSGTSSKWAQYQYTIDGTSWNVLSNNGGTLANAFTSTPMVTLTFPASCSNNANFGFRIVSIFDPSGSDYASVTGGATAYSTAGTWRIDNVTFSSGALSTNSFSQINGLKMYPNPAKNNLFIETALNSDINVSIVNMLGKEVVNANVVNNTVNVSNLTSGIYIVKITEEGKTSTKKLIIE
jgi:hypothetical protein